MRVWIAAVGAKPRAGFEDLARMYLERMAPYLSGGGKGGVEAPVFRTEEGLWAAVERERARTTPRVVLLDEGGRQMGSEEFAQWLGGERDAGRQLVIFAVGPADGWKQNSEQRAQFPGKHWGSAGGPVVVDKKANRQAVRRHTAGEAMVLSLGPMTMAHELARVVICEQVYRALTILAGHPYHRV